MVTATCLLSTCAFGCWGFDSLPFRMKKNKFDKFADKVSHFTAKSVFFAACLLLVVLWGPTNFFMNIDTAQLLINTPTTIITFLLVGLAQNTQSRDMKALQEKLDALLEEAGREDEEGVEDEEGTG